MKLHANWWMVPAVALSLGACGEKQKPAETGGVSPKDASQPQSQEVAPAPQVPAKPAGLTPEKRAETLGFARYLPQDVEMVVSIHNGRKTADRLKSSKLWKFMESEGKEMLPVGGGMEEDGDLPKLPDLPDAKDEGAFHQPGEGAEFRNELVSTAGSAKAEEDPEEAGEGDAEQMAGPENPLVLLEQEVTIAMGKTTGQQIGHLFKLNSRMGYFQMRELGKALCSAAKSGNSEDLESVMDNQYGPELFKALLADTESGMGLIEKLRMPPLYIAVRASEKNRAATQKRIDDMIVMGLSMGEVLEPVSVEKAGVKFSGAKMPGAKLAETLTAGRDEMEKELDAATVDKIIAALSKNDLVVASGVVGDYVVMFVGASLDDLVIAESPAASLLGSDALAFCDTYAAKDLAAVMYSHKSWMDPMQENAGGLAEMASGLRDGLAGAEGMGDTRDLQEVLRAVGEREGVLKKMIGNESGCSVAYFEDGLKFESIGGTDSGAVDWKSPNRLAVLGDSEDVALFANMSSDAAHDKALRSYVESVGQAAFAMTQKMSAMSAENPELAQFSAMFKVFDESFRPDLVSLWDAFSVDMGAGLGSESAFVVDFKGSMPTIPGLPQAVVDKAKCPRLAVVAPVVDRAGLAASWDKMNSSLTSMVGKIGEMSGSKIPMQKPMSSKNDGFTTWFFSMPFINDDFVPSVTVGDKWFSASTSKNQSLDLLAKAEKGGETRTGVYFSMNFKAVQAYARETVKLMETDGGEMLGDGGPSEEDLEAMNHLVSAMDDLDKLTVHARRDQGAMRTSVHFKTR